MQTNDRKKMIQQGFDTVAAGYDHPSLSFFPETAKRLVEHLQLNPTDHLLDVCTGTGCVALTAAEKLTQGKVTGIDLSSGMLQQATNKAAAKGLSNTEFQQMDLEHLEFEATRPIRCRHQQLWPVLSRRYDHSFEQHRQHREAWWQGRHHHLHR